MTTNLFLDWGKSNIFKTAQSGCFVTRCVWVLVRSVAYLQTAECCAVGRSAMCVQATQIRMHRVRRCCFERNTDLVKNFGSLCCYLLARDILQSCVLPYVSAKESRTYGCEFQAYRSGAADDFIILGNDAASGGHRIPTFRRNILLSSSGVNRRPLKVKAEIVCFTFRIRKVRLLN